MKDLTAVILAAGQGKRIQPIVTSKALLPFCGQTMLKWIVTGLEKAGLKRLIIIASPDNQAAIKEDFKNKKVDIVIQSRPTGMAEAVLAARGKLSTSAMMVVNGDDLLSQQTYKIFINTIKKQSSRPAITGFKTDQYFPGGYLKLQAGKIVGVVEKPGPGKEPSPYVKLVLDYFPQAKDFINLLEKSSSKKDDVYEIALAKLFTQTSAELVKAQEYFAVLKYPWHILDAMNLCLKYHLKPAKAKSAQIHKTAVIEGPVQIEAGVKIMANAVIKGPAYIGKNVIIGNNVLVRNSTIEEGTVVGYNTEIARSYVGPHNWFHSNYIGDSIIEGNSNLGSGARLANLRFDEKEIMLKKEKGKLPTAKTKLGAVLAKGAKLGINASIMPGITIGANSIIGSGVVLNHPVKPNSKVYVKQQLVS